MPREISLAAACRRFSYYGYKFSVFCGLTNIYRCRLHRHLPFTVPVHVHSSQLAVRPGPGPAPRALQISPHPLPPLCGRSLLLRSIFFLGGGEEEACRVALKFARPQQKHLKVHKFFTPQCMCVCVRMKLSVFGLLLIKFPMKRVSVCLL